MSSARDSNTRPSGIARYSRSIRSLRCSAGIMFALRMFEFVGMGNKLEINAAGKICVPVTSPAGVGVRAQKQCADSGGHNPGWHALAAWRGVGFAYW